MRWLGVSLPRWLGNELVRSRDILHTSLDLCAEIFEDLHAYCASLGIPLGCNVAKKKSKPRSSWCSGAKGYGRELRAAC